ncbi:MAG: glycosyltransferase family 4 protein [Planctomyces sp.]|nr:glycosyltransferase family 4 protein [Planctomyces sp.]
MRRLLYITYLFPPANNVGVHRTVRFLKSLPECGWMPTVLTPDRPKVQGVEPSLVERLDSGLSVVRTGSMELLNYGRSLDSESPSGNGWMETLLQPPRDLWRYLALPDEKLGWVPSAVRAGARLLRQQSFDAIFVTGKPFSSFWIGHRLSRRFGIPWVMDLRDLWTLNRRIEPKSRLHGRIESWMERRLVHSASAVIANTPGNREDFRQRYPECPADRFVTITNGFDRDDFAAETPKTPDRFVIGYAGNFYFRKQAKTGLYRRLLGLDRRREELYETHSPRFLFQGLAELFRRRPELRSRVEVRMAGAKNSAIGAMARESGIEDRVTQLGWLTHADSMQMLQAAHLNCVVLSRGEESDGWIPSKLYQYLGSGTPILGLLPEGDAASIIRRTRTGRVAPPDDIARIADSLESMIADISSGTIEPSDTAEIERYEGRRLTADLARVLDAASGVREHCVARSAAEETSARRSLAGVNS